MDFDREEARRRRHYEKAREAERKQAEKLAELKRSARTAKSRLLASTTRSETWHRMALGWLERDAGYSGEMASARVWLRSLSVHAYSDLMAQAAASMPEHTRTIDVEFALVNANHESWTIKGDALLLQRAKDAYNAEAESFQSWQHDHPDSHAWRAKPATRNQGFLIARMAAQLGIDLPMRMNRGEAHDWIKDHGGNLRLTSNQPDQRTTGAIGDDTDESQQNDMGNAGSESAE